MDISEAAKTALRNRIGEVLESVLVENRIAPVPRTLMKAIDFHTSMNRHEAEHLMTLVSDGPFFEIIYSHLCDVLSNLYVYDQEATQERLGDLILPGKLDSIPDEILQTVQNMPMSYEVVVALPSISVGSSARLAIGPSPIIRDIAILSAAEAEARYPDEEGRPPRDALQELVSGRPRWRPDSVYLVLGVNGYIPAGFLTETLERALQVLKAIVGMAAAGPLLTFERGGPTRSGNAPIYVCCRGAAAANWKWSFTYRGEDELGQILQRIMVAPSVYKMTHEEIAHWAARLKEEAITLCQDGEPAERLRRGFNWYISSMANRDDVLAFVQAATCLESILGEQAKSDAIGLNVLLATRCAYQAAHSVSDREWIYAMFRKCYDKRSRILHSGEHRLSGKEMGLLHDIQILCKRALFSEMRLLENDRRPAGEWR